MTSLNTPNVATDPEAGWPFYALHIMGSNLVREYFLVANYKRCIKHAANYRTVTKRNIELIEKTQGSFPHKTQLLAGAKEITDWVAKGGGQLSRALCEFVHRHVVLIRGGHRERDRRFPGK